MVWIPNFGLLLWVQEADESNIQAAEADRQRRPFTVRYILEDPPARQYETSQIALPAHQHRDVTIGNGLRIPVRFEANENGRMGSISFRPTAVSATEAIHLTYPGVTQQISLWSAVMGIPIGLYGLVVLDDTHGVRHEARPKRVAAESFWLPLGTQLGEEWQVVLGLYREAKSSTSPYSQFIMFFKVLEGFFERKDILSGQVKMLLKNSGKRFREPANRITGDMLVMAMAPPPFQSEWEGKSFGEFFKYLDRTQRIRLAHTFPKNQAPLNPDSFCDYQETVFLANLLDQIAHALIVEHLAQITGPPK